MTNYQKFKEAVKVVKEAGYPYEIKTEIKREDHLVIHANKWYLRDNDIEELNKLGYFWCSGYQCFSTVVFYDEDEKKKQDFLKSVQ